MTAIVALDTKALGLKCIEFSKRERNLTVDALLHLMEFDNRRGWVEFNCRTLWEFCTSELGLLDCATSFRVRAVKILREHPQAEAYLRDGRLYMTTLVPLLPVLTKQNATELFDRCSRLSREKVEKVVREIAPIAGPKPKLRAYPQKKVEAEAEVLAAQPQDVAESEETSIASEEGVDASSEKAPVASAAFSLVSQIARKLGVTMRPVNAREYALHGTVDQEFVDLLDQLKHLFSHSIPTGDFIEVLRRAMQIALEDKLRKKAAKTKNPGKSKSESDETISAPVRREVWERDEGCCSWKYPNGKVCKSRWMVEFDHIVSPKRGGKSDAANVRLLCRDHNDQHARDTWGSEYIENRKREAKREREAQKKRAKIPLP